MRARRSIALAVGGRNRSQLDASTASWGGFESLGGPPPAGDFTDMTTASLCDGLPAATLVLHDELDNLVPIAQSEHLVATCGADVVYWLRDGVVDPSAVTHGALVDEPAFPSASSYGLVLERIREVLARETARAWGVRKVWATLRREGRPGGAVAVTASGR